MRKESAKKSMRNLVAFALAALFVPAGMPSQSSAPRPITFQTLPVDVDARPEPFLFVLADNGKRYLAYELFVANWTDHDLRFARIDVEDAATGRVLVSYDRAALESPFRQRSTREVIGDPSPQNRLFAAGRTALVAVGIRLEPGAAAPSAVRHRILFEADPRVRLIRDDGSLTEELVSISASFPIDSTVPIEVGPPVRGGPWRCANGLGLGNSHHAIYASRTARMRVPQRFGCDFFKIDAGGNILPSPFPDVINAGMFYSYGEEVLAVADARVAATRDGIPEGVPQADGSIRMPVPLTEDTFAGNWIALDLGGGRRYAFYAHLQPGSVRVRAGDRVRRGQVIGLVGMSGNATGPHLHFHVGNGPSLNGSDGIPYVFKSYILDGRGRPGGGDVQARRVIESVPLQDSVMIFPGHPPR